MTRRRAFKYGLTRARTPVTVTVGWADPPVDVSAAVVSGRVSHGSGESNSERSTVAVARGTMVLQGADFQPGRSSRFTEAVLTRRAACKVMLGSTLLWQGWAERPRASPRSLVPLTRFTLTGLLDTHSRAKVDVASATANLYTDATAWADVVGAVPRLTGASGAGITFAPFAFSGRGFEFASLAAQVGGRLAGEDRQGQLTMPTFGRLPASQVAVTNVRHLVRAVETEQKVEQIRNRLTLPFSTEGTSRAAGATGAWNQDPLPNQANANIPYATTATLTLPIGALAQGETRENLAVTVTRAEMRVVDDFQVARSFTLQTIDVSSRVSASVAIQGTNAVVSISFDNDDVTFTWTFRGTSQGSHTLTWDRWIDPASTQGNFDSVSSYYRPYSLRVAVTVSFNIRLPDVIQDKSFQNPTSAEEWGIRPVDWPLWVANENLGPAESNGQRIQADLDDLAQPRTYHDVTLPLWQPDAARSAEIAALDYGSYVDLGIRDDRRGVNIADKCVITERTLDWGARQVPAVRLRCLHTGEAGTAPVQDRPLRIGTTPLRIGTTPIRLEIA